MSNPVEENNPLAEIGNMHAVLGTRSAKKTRTRGRDEEKALKGEMDSTQTQKKVCQLRQKKKEKLPTTKGEHINSKNKEKRASNLTNS